MPSKKTEVSEPKSRNAVLTRQRILEAAVAQFAEEGFAKASIDRIVEAVDLTKGAVYHHFKDKSQLFEAAFLAVEDRFSERLQAGLRGVDDPRVRLTIGIDLFLAACRDPQFLRVAVLEAPAALGWERWRQLEEDYFLGVVTASLAAQYGEVAAGDLAPMVVGAASAAGLALGTAGASRSASERQRLAGLVVGMVDGLRP
jgi:AcrR family transcriptional regulator